MTCLVVHMSYCPLVGETISSLDVVKAELLELYINHLRWGLSFWITYSHMISMLLVLGPQLVHIGFKYEKKHIQHVLRSKFLVSRRGRRRRRKKRRKKGRRRGRRKKRKKRKSIYQIGRAHMTKQHCSWSLAISRKFLSLGLIWQQYMHLDLHSSFLIFYSILINFN